MPQFDVATYSSQIFWVLLSFVTLWIGIVVLISPRLERRLRQREEKIQRAVVKAEKLDHQLQERSQQRLKRLAQAEIEATQLVHQTVLEMEHYKNDSLLQVQKKINERLELARSSLVQEQESLKEQIEDWVVKSVEQVLPKMMGEAARQDDLRKTGC